MSGTLGDTIKTLISHLRDETTPAEGSVIHSLVDAFENGRVSYMRESWHDIHADHSEPIRGELLLRAVRENGTAIKPESISAQFKTAQAGILFDQLVVLTAIDQAIHQNQFPISINISSRHAEDSSALLGFHKLLDRHFAGQYAPKQITFEFLEDYQPNQPDSYALQYMRNALGYKFAIDDQSHEDNDAQRLTTLGPLVDFIKIDGKTFDLFKNGQLDFMAFDNFMSRIKDIAPQAELLGEWVTSPEEAQDLAEIYPSIRFVQGRDLDECEESFIERLQRWKNIPGNRFFHGPPAP
jgi:EAL domain-containing protein (putative c-di-GMP-specific phosphodiesterase class I)